MPCPRVPTQIVAFCVMVSLLLLRRLPRNPQGLSHRLANRHKGVLLRISSAGSARIAVIYSASAPPEENRLMPIRGEDHHPTLVLNWAMIPIKFEVVTLPE